MYAYFYPRSPCGERHTLIPALADPAAFLSTLSLRRATNQRHWCYGQRAISIHALLAESDTSSSTSGCRLSVFLSTLSLRRATPCCKPLLPTCLNFYPRSPCGERPGVARVVVEVEVISIHALLAESDAFLLEAAIRIQISIHALLAESDPEQKRNIHDQRHFYPRSPCGERPGQLGGQRRPPAISIHALLAESDA